MYIVRFPKPTGWQKKNDQPLITSSITYRYHYERKCNDRLVFKCIPHRDCFFPSHIKHVLDSLLSREAQPTTPHSDEKFSNNIVWHVGLLLWCRAGKGTKNHRIILRKEGAQKHLTESNQASFRRGGREDILWGLFRALCVQSRHVVRNFHWRILERRQQGYCRGWRIKVTILSTAFPFGANVLHQTIDIGLPSNKYYSYSDTVYNHETRLEKLVFRQDFSIRTDYSMLVGCVVL